MTLSISVNGGRQKHEKVNGFYQVQRGKVANEFSSKLIYFKERSSEINTCGMSLVPSDIQLFFNFELLVPALR